MALDFSQGWYNIDRWAIAYIRVPFNVTHEMMSLAVMDKMVGEREVAPGQRPRTWSRARIDDVVRDALMQYGETLYDILGDQGTTADYVRAAGIVRRYYPEAFDRKALGYDG